MKKYLPYIIVLIALGVASVWFIKTQTSGTINEQEGNFAVKDQEDIAKIILTDTKNNKIELTKSSGLWIVNCKDVAREDLVKQLFEAVTRITSLCPVPTAAHDNVIRELMAEHIRVEILDEDGDVLKSYWVGGPSVDGLYTYMLLEIDGKPASRPQMVYIPNVKGYVTHRYGTDVENWRVKVVFNYKPEEIKSLSVNYKNEPDNSFTITRVAADSFSLSPSDEKYRITEEYKQKYIRQYLGFYGSISAEAYDNQNPFKDSIMAYPPYCTITVTETDNSVNEVKMYYMPINKRSKSQFDEQGNERTVDMERSYASIHGGKDFAVVQYYVFGTLMRNYKDFFFKPEQVQ